MNTTLLKRPKHRDYILKLFDKYYEKAKDSRCKDSAYEAFKSKARNYFKAIQDEQASRLKKEKKELEQLSTILEYNFEHSEDQMENAKARLFQIEDDSIVRQHSKFLAK